MKIAAPADYKGLLNVQGHLFDNPATSFCALMESWVSLVYHRLMEAVRFNMMGSHPTSTELQIMDSLRANPGQLSKGFWDCCNIFLQALSASLWSTQWSQETLQAVRANGTELFTHFGVVRYSMGGRALAQGRPDLAERLLHHPSITPFEARPRKRPRSEPRAPSNALAEILAFEPEEVEDTHPGN